MKIYAVLVLWGLLWGLAPSAGYGRGAYLDTFGLSDKYGWYDVKFAFEPYVSPQTQTKIRNQITDQKLKEEADRRFKAMKPAQSPTDRLLDAMARYRPKAPSDSGQSNAYKADIVRRYNKGEKHWEYSTPGRQSILSK